KLWNASRLVLLNVEPPPPDGRSVPAEPEAPEDRWILSRLESTIATFDDLVSRYDFSHAVGELYDFVFSDLCDWYLEIVKPRIYDGDPALAPVVLSALERTLALVHPVMPFVTEQIWSYHPYREGDLAVHALPVADRSRIDPAGEASFGEAIETTRRLRSWRDIAGVPPATVLEAVGPPDGVGHEFVTRLGRVEVVEGEGSEPFASVAGFGILPAEGLDIGALTERLDGRRKKLEQELEKVVARLGSKGFAEKAPAEVIDEERRREEDLRERIAGLG
ncbi:MAG: class I tRNA ligase family protein, partial [Solirubrobacterales bacterium]